MKSRTTRAVTADGGQRTTAAWEFTDLDAGIQSTSRRLVIAVITVVLIISGLAGLTAYQDWIHHRDRTATATENLASLLARQVSETIVKTDVALRSAAFEVEQEIKQEGKVNGATLTAFLEKQKELLPEIVALRATDTAGNVRFGPGLEPASKLNLAEREYFRKFRENPKADLVVFGPIFTQISKTWVLVLVRGLFGPKEEFAGVIYALIPTDKFRRDFEALNLGAEGAVSLRMADLALVARATVPPTGGSAVGARQASSELIAALQAHPASGNFVARTAIDQIERSNSYRKVGTYPLYVIVGLGSRDILSEWHRELSATILFALLALLVTIAGGRMILGARKKQLASIRAMAESESRFRAIFNSVNDAIVIHDGNTGKPVDVNRRMCEMFGVTHEEALACGPDDLSAGTPPYSSAEALAWIRLALAKGPQSFDWLARAKNGHLFWVEVSLRNAQIGAEQRVLAVVRDNSQRKEWERQLEFKADTDHLTGVCSRGHFLELASKELERVRRYRSPMSIAMLDLDNFKVVNDTYGHAVGDRVLVEVTTVCRRTLREPDVMGRLGGEEFAVLFPETNAAEAMDVAERMREAVADARIPLEHGLPISITVSIGIATFTDADVNIDVFLNRADKALYDAKHGGRNKTCEAAHSA